MDAKQMTTERAALMREIETAAKGLANCAQEMRWDYEAECFPTQEDERLEEMVSVGAMIGELAAKALGHGEPPVDPAGEAMGAILDALTAEEREELDQRAMEAAAEGCRCGAGEEYCSVHQAHLIEEPPADPAAEAHEAEIVALVERFGACEAVYADVENGPSPEDDGWGCGFPAEVELTEKVGGTERTRRLCADCAMEENRRRGRAGRPQLTLCPLRWGAMVRDRLEVTR